jgi:hypothetical protein
MAIRWTTSLSVISACLVTAALAGAGCSDDPDAGSGGSGGATASSSSSATSSSGGSGGAGGMMGCGDTMTDPMNCGFCDNACAPGQTCAAGVCTCGSSSVAFADVQAILTQSCATSNCHSGGLPKAGMDLTDGNAHGNLVNMGSGQCNDGRMRVLPGDPSESYIIDKVMGVDLCGTGKRMPPLISLSEDKIKTIADWICGGALP